jgi:hypothetical protein
VRSGGKGGVQAARPGKKGKGRKSSFAKPLMAGLDSLSHF